MAAEAPIKQYFTGIVKQVKDGGLIEIRGQPRNGPPPVRTLALAELDAPKLARRPNQNNPTGSVDEPWAWESREFLRKLLVGKSVLATVQHQISSGREFGHCLIGSTDPEKAENVGVKLVAEGLARVRDNCTDSEFNDAQDAAKSAGKGIHSSEPISNHVRNVIWETENPRQLVDRMAGNQIDAIIDSVRDGSTIRAFLLPDMYHITMSLSGVRAPTESYAEHYEEATYFTESRLLQQEVKIILESNNNKNFVGSIIHPNGNIAEALLREGLAKCVEWQLGVVTGGGEKYRKAQEVAKDAKKRIWKNYDGPSGPQLSARDKEFTGKVVEIVNGDAIMVKKNKTETKKIFLASMKPPPRPEGLDNKIKPLYDIPFMFEAREFLRKKLIGQNVHVIVDYVQPVSTDELSGRAYPEKICGTITIGGVNVAEALVSKGLASVVRHKHDDDERSSHYNDLLSAEEKAKKSNKGMYSKNAPNRRITDMAGDVNKSKQFLPFLQRAGRMQAVVEFVASGSRFRVYIPRETCVVTLLLAGISCPRASRVFPGSAPMEAEPFGDEAMAHIKDMVLQREVEIEVEAIDKGGNFIGWCFIDNTNLSVALVEEGFASVHVTAERSNYGRLIAIAEDNAKRRKDRRWANYVEEEAPTKDEEDEKKDDGERKVNYQTIVITEVGDDLHVYGQCVDEGPKLEGLMTQLREEFTRSPPLAGAYTPRNGDLCAAKFLDGQWYRGKVLKTSATEATILYIDYGNRETIPKAKCAALPSSFTGLPGFAKEYGLAFLALPPDEEYAASGLKALKDDVLDRQVKINTEYKIGTLEFVTVSEASNSEDIGKNLVTDGLMMVEKKGGRRLAKLVNSYIEAQDAAKKNHLNIWEYGDITVDDSREFGAPAPRT